eukprot:1178671-Prorocentrum_minimum.AAC.5
MLYAAAPLHFFLCANRPTHLRVRRQFEHAARTRPAEARSAPTDPSEAASSRLPSPLRPAASQGRTLDAAESEKSSGGTDRSQTHRRAGVILMIISQLLASY